MARANASAEEFPTAETVEDAIRNAAAGLQYFGENRVQEATRTYPDAGSGVAKAKS